MRRWGEVRRNLVTLQAAQKSSTGTPAYSRYLNRPAGRLVAAVGATFGLTPNLATAISASLSGAGLLTIAVARPEVWWGFAISALLAAGYVLDSTDGQLARLHGSGTVRGEWLDHTVDAFKTSAIHLTVAISWFRFPPASNDAFLLIPLGYAVVQSVTYFCLILVPFLRKTAGTASTSKSLEPAVRKWLILPTDYGFLCWLFVLLPSGRVFLTAYSAMFILSSALLALALRKWWQELGAGDRSS